ncbi:hypothetical protein CC2G_010042 [Coprinopsis cinerea AmutBmut pab1-1]|nr:hypothetical protein CC2G_010042 [Coprinopsis cinerea AmutBmut pab1-1]
MTTTSPSNEDIVMADVQPQPAVAATTASAQQTSPDGPPDSTHKPFSVQVTSSKQVKPNANPNPNAKAKSSSDGHRLTFPQNFTISAEVKAKLIPFKEFKERGICVEPRADDPEELEVDTLGVPTVALPKVHDTDRCKTNTKRKRRREEAARDKERLGGRGGLPWWEHWEVSEEGRRVKNLNSKESRVQKLLAAASDFKSGRPWPAGIGQQTDPAYIWSKFESYLGIVSIPVGKKKKPKVFRELDHDSDFSDEDGEDGDGDNNLVVGKDKKTVAFIKDPVESTKIFLSSYARAKGIIWSAINLTQMPRLMQFFLQFLIRSRVFPESETGFRLALDVANQAFIELPLAFDLGADLSPEPFGKACQAVWGRKAEGYRSVEHDAEFLASLEEPSKITEVVEGAPEGEQQDGAPEAPQLLDTTSEGWVPSPWGATDETSGNEASGGWGSGGWGAPESGGGWGETGGEDGALNSWMTVEEDSSPKVVLPDAIGQTHTTGIVERSLRRIKNLLPIPANLPPPAEPVDGAVPDAADIEATLERAYPKVVLTPWLNWDGGEMPVYSSPTILDTSNGPVVEPPFTARDASEEAPKLAPGEVKKHDPGNDDITIFVEPSIFEKLQNAKGMAIAGTWVQIVRKPKETSDEPPPAKKKKGKKKSAANIWYLDDLGGIFPSFWTVQD